MWITWSAPDRAAAVRAEETTMKHADPWDEIPRLETLLEAHLRAGLERSRLYASADCFCTERCRLDDRCRLADAIPDEHACPLWMYLRTRPLSS